jgi:hypothetical protein
MAWKPDYIDTAAFSEFVRVDDTVDDAVVQVAITSASRAIDAATNRQFGSATGERLYTAQPNYDLGLWVVVVDDIQTTDGLVILCDGEEITEYRMDPPNAVADGKVWTRIVIKESSSVQPTGADMEMAITADPWGWSAIPDAVVHAAELQTNRFVNRRDSWAGVAGSPDSGTEIRLLKQLDPDVRMSLTDYVRPREVF